MLYHNSAELIGLFLRAKKRSSSQKAHSARDISPRPLQLISLFIAMKVLPLRVIGPLREGAPAKPVGEKAGDRSARQHRHDRPPPSPPGTDIGGGLKCACHS